MAPQPRRGPRPLALHLATALAAWTSSPVGWALSNAGSPSSNAPAGPPASEAPPGPRRRQKSAKSPPESEFAAALTAEAARRAEALARGIATYRTHPWRRDLPDPETIWREGTTRLLDFGPPGGRPVLVVPSLINRAYILDLAPGRSLMRWLAGQGVRPLLVDWDAPGPAERALDLTGYVAGRLSRALDRATALAGGPVPVVGYCMGGLLALGLASQRPEAVARLALLATPWDFHAERAESARMAGTMLDLWEPALEPLGELPVDLLQALFWTIDPLQVVRKFVAFASVDPAAPRALDFVAIEDWLNDGVGLALPVARECLAGWYGANTPARGEWRVAGRAVEPAGIRIPSLVVVPRQDRIVPPPSARALAAALPQADILSPAAGHIGMVAGSRAEATVWPALAAFLAAGRPRARTRPRRAERL
ncbi:MAG: alpha/beta fold hydrolase [Alphaproteobacteria bacterium]